MAECRIVGTRGLVQRIRKVGVFVWKGIRKNNPNCHLKRYNGKSVGLF